jgi:hypothetical protein
MTPSWRMRAAFFISHIREPGSEEEPATLSTEIEGEWAKRITPYFGLSVGGAFRHLSPKGEKTINGFGNLALGAKYQFFTSAEHEAILSTGVDSEVGDTGDAKAGADPFSTVSPTFFVGKGMGDLPGPMKYLRPFTLTGVFGANFPTVSRSVTTRVTEEGEVEQEVERPATTLTWGLSVQYNLQYLQSFVRDVGLPAPFNRMIPLVEFPMQTCINRDCDGQTTGFANPGVVWFGKYIQLGIEAQVPINNRTGHDVGVLAQLHFFIDDIFPTTVGRPFFGQVPPRPPWWQNATAP